MKDFRMSCANYLPSASEILITLTGPKLHGIYVTESDLNYSGSITIDQEIIETAGLYPLEFVNIWNKNNGARISTYILPGQNGSGICCLNGAAARSCQVGDQIIVTSERSLPRRLISKYSVNVLTFSPDNKILGVTKYNLELGGDECRFAILE